MSIKYSLEDLKKFNLFTEYYNEYNFFNGKVEIEFTLFINDKLKRILTLKSNIKITLTFFNYTKNRDFTMVKLHKVAGKVMGFLEAFEGSRPALDSGFILIVRGMSSKNIAIADMKQTLDDLIVFLDGKEVEPISDEAAAIINRMDEQIRASVPVNNETDAGGIERMKKELEILNVAAEYKLFTSTHTGVFVVMWKDKSDSGPLFIETVISDDEKG